jgi:hypothetical protein
VEQANLFPAPAVDADFVAMPDGTYRLYYAAEPITGDRRLFSAVSSDGRAWTADKQWTIEGFGGLVDVVRLPNGSFRLYQSSASEGEQAITSLWSANGTDWMLEPGARLERAGHGADVTMVGAAAVARQGDRYVMVYNGEAPTKYEPGRRDQDRLLYWADSTDGLTFQKRGLVLETRNEELRGSADSPDLAVWSDGSLRVLFWSNRGIYMGTLEDGQLREPRLVVAKTQTGDSWPADPTLGRVGNDWILYYNYHHRGVYYATYAPGG